VQVHLDNCSRSDFASPPEPTHLPGVGGIVDEGFSDRAGNMSDAKSQHRAATIAIVSWNTRSLLADCLGSLREDMKSGIADVWVVDNASSDGSAEMVSERFPSVNLIPSAQNLGFGAAVNAVAARTRSNWVVPANADVRLDRGALRTLLAEGERHPEAAVIAPRLILPDGATQHSVYPFPTIPFTLAYVSGATRLSGRLARHWCIEDGFDPARGREVAWAVGAFLLVRRTAWAAVGGFDETQWMYAEDLDLGWRLRRAGWTARYVPEARVFHEESASTTQAWGDDRHLRWHASTYQWMSRRRGATIARVVAAINVCGFLLRGAVSLPGELLGSDAARHRRRSSLNAARAHGVGLRLHSPRCDPPVRDSWRG
jgi:N-acetylglucosaminyl-diphospho-decaprenol L-rhamnosyltransferase